MTVDIISVGTEILLGEIVNTNAVFIAEHIAALGFSSYSQKVVGDNAIRLKEALKASFACADLVILTGGLGPTEDDITKEVVAKVFNSKLIMHEETKQQIQLFFDKRQSKEVTNNNWKQALIPEGSIVLGNNNGTAPGIILEKNGKCCILLPGPPEEMQEMFIEKVEPYLKNKSTSIIFSKTVKICGISESKVDALITDMLQNGKNPTIAPYAKRGEVHLRITAKAENELEANERINPIIDVLQQIFKNAIYTIEENTTLEMAIVNLLKDNKMTLSTVESCTGGMLSSRIINVPGVSTVFHTGIVTYSNEAKMEFVDVKKETLALYGAVSEEVVREMAIGQANRAKSSVCIAITGIAGPDGGTVAKPVGLVYIGCTIFGNISVKKCFLLGNREKIRERTVFEALVFTRECVMAYLKSN